MIPRNFVSVGAMAATADGKHRWTTDTFGSHALIAMVIMAGHGFLLMFIDNEFSRADRAPVQMDEPVSVAWIRVQSPYWDASPLPEVQPARLPTSLSTLEQIQFELNDEDELKGVAAPSSAPRLSRYQAVSSEDFARRAGVNPNHPITVVVALDVLRNGAVGAISVIRSCGDARKDAIAAEYARQLQWIAGTIEQQPRRMRIQFAVTLAVPSHAG